MLTCDLGRPISTESDLVSNADAPPALLQVTRSVADLASHGSASVVPRQLFPAGFPELSTEHPVRRGRRVQSIEAQRLKALQESCVSSGVVHLHLRTLGLVARLLEVLLPSCGRASWVSEQALKILSPQAGERTISAGGQSRAAWSCSRDPVSSSSVGAWCVRNWVAEEHEDPFGVQV